MNIKTQSQMSQQLKSIEESKTFRDSAAQIQRQNAIPIFAIITPMSSQTWNKHRLQVRRTSHLNYFHQYQKM